MEATFQSLKHKNLFYGEKVPNLSLEDSRSIDFEDYKEIYCNGHVIASNL